MYFFCLSLCFPSYRQHIIESVSHLFDPSNKPHWNVIQQTEGGTAELMELLETFAATIARTSQSFNYTPQFSVIAPHISKYILYGKNVKLSH